MVRCFAGLRRNHSSVLLLYAAIFWHVDLIPARKSVAAYVGAEACGSCHREQWEKQSLTAHAHSLHQATDHPLASRFLSIQSLARNLGYRFAFSRRAGELRVRVSDSSDYIDLPVEWAFGAGDHAVTFVSQINDKVYLEHTFSYYSAIGSFDITPGHEEARPSNLIQAAGVPFETLDPNQDILRCFGCHSTGPLSLGPRFDIRPQELGVRCEVCHGPGRAHVEAMGRGDIKKARGLIRNPGHLAAKKQIQFCGNCHRKPPASGQTMTWDNPWNTRHQPIYLSQSACFKRSGTLSCTTCHNPHERVRKNDAAYYNARCVGCHNSGTHPPVETSDFDDCTACHMPAVEPRPYIQFANHWIGVYSNGDTLKPSR